MNQNRKCGFCKNKYEQSIMIRTKESPNGWCCQDCTGKLPNYVPRKIRKKSMSNMGWITEINRLAKAEGLDYGKYVDKYGL